MTWIATKDGYELPEIGARLRRSGRVWRVEQGDRVAALGRRATFDDAERVLRGWAP